MANKRLEVCTLTNNQRNAISNWMAIFTYYEQRFLKVTLSKYLNQLLSLKTKT